MYRSPGDRFTSRSMLQPLSRILRGKSVEGALLSVGDGRFAQGDGEIKVAGFEGSLR
jgi:acetamidase/formamidase